MFSNTIEKLKYKPSGDEDAVNQVYIAGWNDALESVKASGKLMNTEDVIEMLEKVPWLYTHPTELRLIEVWFKEEEKKHGLSGL